MHFKAMEDYMVISDEEDEETVLMEVVEDVEKAETSSKNKSKASTSMQEQEHQKFPSEEVLNKLCAEASRSCFMDVEPGYDRSQNGGPDSAWRCATVKFGKVKLEKPVFWSNESSKPLKMLPHHARLQRMTYSSRIEVDFQIFVAQEQKCHKRLGVYEKPNCCIYFHSEMMKKLNVAVRLEEVPPSVSEHLKGQKILDVQFVYCTILLWVFLFALGMPSDKEIGEMIHINLDDATSVNLLLSTISYADNKFEGFRKAGNALEIDQIVKKSILNDGISNTKFPPKESGFPLESAGDCLDKHLFPTLSGRTRPFSWDIWAFSTGTWPHHVSSRQKISGVAVTLQRTNPLQMMSEMRNVRQYVKYTGIVGNARFPHPSHWGKLCFLSTPDGENCGLVKNFAVTGIVSTNLREPLLDKLLECGMEKLMDGLTTMGIGLEFARILLHFYRF
ncbi:hypothetical protein IFM89_011572 [Coptis chinensis]|uniref:DNA-directed RNA polymerase n=1 Tax=Coptis chinensis TaxID=261450 RepID=A0A835H2W8_9MAGN|nr:hypothetical protein IFM89_011572 [Coptis chinensis]